MHGGATATIMDQIAGVLAMLNTNHIVATAELTAKYIAPIRKGETYILKAHLHSHEGRKVFIQSTI